MSNLTEGQYRVGTSFNPSSSSEVDVIKSTAAGLIDKMMVIAGNRDNPGAREAAIAATHFEDAAMWAVKAVTKKPREAE